MTASITESSSATPRSRLPSQSRSLPLERKLPLLIFGVLSLVLALSVGVSYYEVRRAAQSSAGERLSSLSRVLSSMMLEPIGNRLAVMRRVATDPAVVRSLRTPDQPPSAATTKALSALIGRGDSLTPPQLWTPDGRPIGAMRLETPADLQEFQEQLFSHTRISDTAHVGKIYLTAGQASLWSAVPVRLGGDLLGYIAQERRIGTNTRVLQGIRELIGSEFEFFVRNIDGDTWVQLSGDGAPAPTRIREFGSGLQLLTHGPKGPMLASTTPIHGTPLAVTIEQPMSVILSRPRTTIRALGTIAIVLVMLGAIVAWIIGRQLARPLVELTGAAEAMALGNYAERVTNAGGTDEIGRLGAAFNRMADEVQRQSTASADAVQQLTKSVATQLFLAEASRILAGSLSDQVLLAELARHCVPSVGDYCAIYVAEDDGSLRRVETVHYDPTQQDLVRDLASRYPFRLDGPGQIPNVIRSQDALIIPRLDRTAMLNRAPDTATMRLLDEVAPTSFMCVPLVARGRGFGAMAFTMTDSGRVFSSDDADLAMELARRTAVAIDNSFIYRRSLALRLEAEAASSAKSDFLAKMSHEIRTPINAMMGYAELLEMGISGPVSASQAKQLSRIRASGEHLTSLVNEILDLAKIEAGRMAVEPTNALATEAIEVSFALVRPQAASKGVELVSRVDGEPNLEYIGDPQRVQQILTNLLSNAIKFTPQGGRVTLHCETFRGGDGDGESAGEQWTSISVQDTGVGIAREDLERIFDPFVQVEGGYTRLQGGTGLGLTISRALAQLMGGEISVESSVGEGSRFTLKLPAPSSCVADA